MNKDDSFFIFVHRTNITKERVTTSCFEAAGRHIQKDTFHSHWCQPEPHISHYISHKKKIRKNGASFCSPDTSVVRPHARHSTFATSYCIHELYFTGLCYTKHTFWLNPYSHKLSIIINHYAAKLTTLTLLQISTVTFKASEPLTSWQSTHQFHSDELI